MSNIIPSLQGIDTSGVRLTASGPVEWTPRLTLIEFDHELTEKLAEATPTNSDLLEWAARPANQPSDEWWNANDDPFTPDKR